MVKAIVQGGPRRIGTSTPRECLENSAGILAHLLRPGDRLGGDIVREKLHDLDGEVTYVLEDGSFIEFPPMPGRGQGDG